MNSTLEQSIEFMYMLSDQLQQAADADRNYNTDLGMELDHNAYELRKLANRMRQVFCVGIV